MRKLVLVATLVVVLVPFVAAVAYGQDQVIRCKTAPCYGTGNDDKIYEIPRNGANDKIIMRGGRDLVLANGYTNDQDIVRGGTGNDKINVADGDRRDTASGGLGGDLCIVDARREAGMGCSVVRVR